MTLAPGQFEHRLDGEYSRDGRDVDAPLVTVEISAPLSIMASPVSVAEYLACVADNACTPLQAPAQKADLPVTGVNYLDAMAYADWLSRQTGAVWRLPTEAEWAYAAGADFVDDATGIADDPADPAQRWIKEYRLEAARKRGADTVLRQISALPANENGLRGMAGPVWEWTATCLRRGQLDAEGKIAAQEEMCGIYIVSGRHRAAMTLFVRDPKTGGCSVGTPPDNLGFRLVRETSAGWLRSLRAGVGV